MKGSRRGIHKLQKPSCGLRSRGQSREDVHREFEAEPELNGLKQMYPRLITVNLRIGKPGRYRSQLFTFHIDPWFRAT